MKKIIAILFIFIIVLPSCTIHEKKQIDQNTTTYPNNAKPITNQTSPNPESPEDIIIPSGSTIQKRFTVPTGFKRIVVDDGSFGQYLRTLPLKPHGTKVHYYDGRTKNTENVYLAVIDIDVSKRDLQQCADAVMRLRGEYLYRKGDYKAIHFNFTNGFRLDYTKWIEGYRVKVQGNDVSYVKKASSADTYENFRAYMEQIFVYAGTLSLSKELQSIPIMDMQIGDVLIKGGSPGHAVIIVDMAVNEVTNEKCYMIAQSYMPAQDIQILCNPANPESPWYKLEDINQITTPEWTFTSKDLKRFTQ